MPRAPNTAAICAARSQSASDAAAALAAAVALAAEALDALIARSPREESISLPCASDVAEALVQPYTAAGWEVETTDTGITLTAPDC